LRRFTVLTVVQSGDKVREVIFLGDRGIEIADLFVWESQLDPHLAIVSMIASVLALPLVKAGIVLRRHET
jgi:hypothetical protein